MNRKPVFLITLLFLVGISSVTLEVQRVEASGTIYIRADGSIDPPDAPIQSVDNITYAFTGNSGDMLVVEKDSIMIDGAGHTLQGTGISGQGITLQERVNVTVQNTRIESFDCGISLRLSSNITVSMNNITKCRQGIRVEGNEQQCENGSVNNRIIRNNIADNREGIYFDSSCDNSISGNRITNNNGNGILLLSASNNSMTENNIARNFVSINLGSSSNNSISGNNITDNWLGIKLHYSSGNRISGNNITANSEGIYLYSSSNVSISGNNIASSSFGISLDSSSDNNISGNDITSNNWGGMELGYSSDNSISGNNITSNSRYGIFLAISSNNKFYHNSFINNTNQVLSSDSTNVWDDGYPSGGNYWSDYNGTDANNDGIGDTAYLIDANNTDLYPLMGMFNNYNVSYFTPPVVSHYGDVAVISNSTISGFVAPVWIEHSEVIFLEFDVTGEQGSIGFCRVSFPTAMINGTYHVSVNGTEIPYTLLPCSNADYSYLYFTYTHSTQGVIIIPEFSSFLILPILFIATLLAVTVYRRKHGQKN